MTLGEFILKYCEEHKLSQRGFAALAGMSPQGINNIIKGIGSNGKPSKPNIDSVHKIADAVGMSEVELLYMLSDEIVINQRQIPDNIIPMPTTKRIPLIGDIACGEPITAIETFHDTVDIPDNITADFALRCKGDSMINARIFDGDIVYIRSQSYVDNGQIAAVYVKEDDDTWEATLKRVHTYEDHIVLEPQNPMYKPLVFWDDEMSKVEIIGRAVAFTSVIH